MSLPYTISKQSLTIYHDGQPKTLLSSDSNFEKCKQAIQNEDWELAIRLIDPACVIAYRSKDKMIVKDGQVYLLLSSGEHWAVPSVLNKTIIQYMDNNWPFQRLVNFGLKLANNPSAHSVEQLFPFLEHNKVILFDDGDFVLYKKVRNDFLDWYTGTIDNSPGKTVLMPREAVNHDPQQTCSYGLHAANWEYANSHYHGGMGKMLVLKVNPAHVVSVPTDYNNSKIRVCEYYVEREIQQELPEDEYIVDDSENPDVLMLEEMFPDEDLDYLIETWRDNDCNVSQTTDAILAVQ